MTPTPASPPRLPGDTLQIGMLTAAVTVFVLGVGFTVLWLAGHWCP